MTVENDLGLSYLNPLIGLLRKSLSEQELALISVENGRVGLSLEGLQSEIDIHGQLRYHRKTFSGRSFYSEPLCRALGINSKNPDPIVIDATAGLITDSLLIHFFGAQVVCFEKNPLICLFLAQSLQEQKFSSIELRYGELVKQMREYDPKTCVYFDPMFEQVRQRSLPKKNMQLLRKVAKVSSESSQQTLEALCQYFERVVVKRTPKARPLLAGVNHSYTSKTVRYDVYFNPVEGP